MVSFGIVVSCPERLADAGIQDREGGETDGRQHVDTSVPTVKHAPFTHCLSKVYVCSGNPRFEFQGIPE